MQFAAVLKAKLRIHFKCLGRIAYFWALSPTAMEIKIRPYQTADCAAILEIINHNILHSTALYDYAPRTLQQQLDILEEKLKKGFPVVVAETQGRLSGFGYYSEFRFREAYRFTVEHSVYVAQDYSGNGIGKLLLESLIGLAKAQNIHTMIGVIDAENTASIAFHERFGFEKVGFIKESGFKFDRWLHSVFMQKML